MRISSRKGDVLLLGYRKLSFREDLFPAICE